MVEEDFINWTISDLRLELKRECTLTGTVRRAKIEAEIKRRQAKVKKVEKTGIDRVPIGYVSILLGLISLLITNPTIEDGVVISGPILTAVFSLPWYIVLKLGVMLYKYNTTSNINKN